MFNYIKSIKSSWRKTRETYSSISMFRLILLGAITGALAGIVASLFFLGVEGLKFLLLHKLTGLDIPSHGVEHLFHKGPITHTYYWLIPVFTTSVGLITGWLVHRYLPNGQDHCTDGTDAMTKAFHQQEGHIPPKTFLIKGITSVLTIASGGSAGREGPITQIGAGLGSWVSSKLKLSAREKRILLLAGAGGGLGAIFRAPLGGAITSVEIIYREDFETEALLPAIISSVTAYTVFTLVYGNHPMLDIPHFTFHPRELILYFVLAIFCAITGMFYVNTFFKIKYSIFLPINQKIGPILTMGLGGLTMGIIGMTFPQLLSGGYGWLEFAILGKLSITMMLGLLIGKTIATSVTIGSGMSGGMFAPALFVGGMSGGVIGQAGYNYFPNIVANPGAYVLVGMAAFFAGAGSAPVGPFIIVCELAQDYGLLAPLMFASAICILLSRKTSLYENQVDTKFKSPVHSGELFVDILVSHRVKEMLHQLKPAYTVYENMKFSEFKELFCSTEQHYFPVVNKDGELIGIFSSTDFRTVLFDESIEDLVIMKDIAITDFISTTPEEDLSTVLTKFTKKNLDELPVVAADNHNTLLGMLRRREVIAFYNEALAQYQNQT